MKRNDNVEDIAAEMRDKQNAVKTLRSDIVDIQNQLKEGLLLKEKASELIVRVEDNLKKIELDIDAFEYAHLSNVRDTKLAWKVVYGVPDNKIAEDGKVSFLKDKPDPVAWMMNHFYKDPNKILMSRMGSILEKYNCTKEGIRDTDLKLKSSENTQNYDKEFIDMVKNYKEILPNSSFGVCTLEDSLSEERSDR